MNRTYSLRSAVHWVNDVMTDLVRITKRKGERTQDTIFNLGYEKESTFTLYAPENVWILHGYLKYS